MKFKKCMRIIVKLSSAQTIVVTDQGSSFRVIVVLIYIFEIPFHFIATIESKCHMVGYTPLFYMIIVWDLRTI